MVRALVHVFLLLFLLGFVFLFLLLFRFWCLLLFRCVGPQIEPKNDQKSPPGERWGRSGLPAWRPWVHKLFGGAVWRAVSSAIRD